MKADSERKRRTEMTWLEVVVVVIAPFIVAGIGLIMVFLNEKRNNRSE